MKYYVGNCMTEIMVTEIEYIAKNITKINVF